MTENITAQYKDSSYSVSIDLGECVFPIKLDIGANTTVVSIDAYIRNLSETDKSKISDYCEKHSDEKKEFTSASGDKFYGYPVVAHNVYIENVLFDDFFYYVVIDNKRVISLLGVDFLDCCDYQHARHQSITITGFDNVYYQAFLKRKSLETDELIAFIDAL